MHVNLETLPTRMRRLPIDPQRQVPVPWFVQWIEGHPEFRVMDGQKFRRAVRERRCWVCGEVLGKHLAFVIGPMCGVNLTNAEPPCHYECATWSAQNCPFLTRPHMVRREDDLTKVCTRGEAALDRNPGVVGVWITQHYQIFAAKDAAATGYLFEMGPPTRVEWYAEGRRATRDEVLAAVRRGITVLEEMCEREVPALREAARTELAQKQRTFACVLPAP